jgi:hypothetical protein
VQPGRLTLAEIFVEARPFVCAICPRVEVDIATEVLEMCVVGDMRPMTSSRVLLLGSLLSANISGVRAVKLMRLLLMANVPSVGNPTNK